MLITKVQFYKLQGLFHKYVTKLHHFVNFQSMKNLKYTAEAKKLTF